MGKQKCAWQNDAHPLQDEHVNMGNGMHVQPQETTLYLNVDALMPGTLEGLVSIVTLKGTSVHHTVSWMGGEWPHSTL